MEFWILEIYSVLGIYIKDSKTVILTYQIVLPEEYAKECVGIDLLIPKKSFIFD